MTFYLNYNDDKLNSKLGRRMCDGRNVDTIADYAGQGSFWIFSPKVYSKVFRLSKIN